jgi:hypothetical protein
MFAALRLLPGVAGRGDRLLSPSRKGEGISLFSLLMAALGDLQQ